MWDSIIEDVRKIIYQHEIKAQVEHSSFFEVVNSVLIDRCTKSNTSLHFLLILYIQDNYIIKLFYYYIFFVYVLFIIYNVMLIYAYVFF